MLTLVSPSARWRQIYNETARPIVESCIEGYNGTIFGRHPYLIKIAKEAGAVLRIGFSYEAPGHASMPWPLHLSVSDCSVRADRHRQDPHNVGQR